MAKHAAIKIELFSMKLAAFRYNILHISGEENVWADLLSRWGAAEVVSPDPSKISTLMRVPVAPQLEPDFKLPKHRKTDHCTRQSPEKHFKRRPYLVSRRCATAPKE